MAIGKAIKFVKEVVDNKTLRVECNKAESKQKLLDKMGFDEVEFDDAINMQLVKCQSYEEAEQYQQIRMWFLIL